MMHSVINIYCRAQAKLSFRKLFRNATLVIRLITLHTLVMYRVGSKKGIATMQQFSAKISDTI